MHREVDLFARNDDLVATWKELEQGECAGLRLRYTIFDEVGAVEVELLVEHRLLDVTLLDAALDLNLLRFFGVLLAALDLQLKVESLVREDVDTNRFQLNVKDSLVFADTTDRFEHF